MNFRGAESLSAFLPKPKTTGGDYPSFSGLSLAPNVRIQTAPAPQYRRRCAEGAFPALLKRGFILKRERIVAFGGVRCRRSGLRRGARGTSFPFLLTPEGLHTRFGRSAGGGGRLRLQECCDGAFSFLPRCPPPELRTQQEGDFRSGRRCPQAPGGLDRGGGGREGGGGEAAGLGTPAPSESPLRLPWPWRGRERGQTKPRLKRLTSQPAK